MKLSTKILIGLLSGVIVGLFFQGNPVWASTFIGPLGTLFLRLINMIIVPLVFYTIIVGASSVGDMKKLGRLGGKTMAFYLVTTGIAVVIGIVLANIIAPGAGLTLPVDAEYAGREAPPIIEVLLNIIPNKPLEALVQGSMLQIITFALFIGIAITAAGEKAQIVRNFFDGFAEIMYKMTGFVMAFAPYGVFGLIVPVVAVNGPDVLFPLFKIIATVYIGVFLHGFFVYGAALRLFTKLGLLDFYKAIFPAQVIAFSTCSSGATLPVTIKCVEENIGVSKEVSSFVLPLGATINMDGTAVYVGVAALFVAQVYGLELTIAQQLIVVITGALASIGSAGVPGAGLIMLTLVLTSVNLPLEGVALVAGVDRILDMARTTLNITGDAVAAVVVAASEDELELSE